MAKNVPLKIGLKVDVRRGDGTKLYKSSIQNLKGKIISIAMPYLKEHPLVLRKNDTVQVQFVADDNCYLFSTKVLGEVKDNIVLYQLAYPDAIKRIQQRMHFRIEVNFPVRYALWESNALGANIGSDTKTATALDISGGGMRLAVKEKIKDNQLLQIDFTLTIAKQEVPMSIKARVMRSFLRDERNQIYNVGVKFEDLNLNQEDRIVRYTFERMAQQKRLL